MPKFGIYRTEQAEWSEPFTELRSYHAEIRDGIYAFFNHSGELEAAYPSKAFYMVKLED